MGRWAFVLGFSLLLAPVAQAAGSQDAKGTLPLHCDDGAGGHLGAGHLVLGSNGDVSGSIALDDPALSDGTALCLLFCRDETDTNHLASDSCGTFKHGHRTFHFKAKGLGLDAKLPTVCRKPVVEVDVLGTSCLLGWQPKRPPD